LGEKLQKAKWQEVDANKWRNQKKQSPPLRSPESLWYFALYDFDTDEGPFPIVPDGWKKIGKIIIYTKISCPKCGKKVSWNRRWGAFICRCGRKRVWELREGRSIPLGYDYASYCLECKKFYAERVYEDTCPYCRRSDRVLHYMFDESVRAASFCPELVMMGEFEYVSFLHSQDRRHLPRPDWKDESEGGS